MMGISHTESAFNELRKIVDGDGDTVTVICGPSGPFYAGVRRAPSSTLLEAILSVAADRSVYERIAVFSARGDHLPRNAVMETFRVGEACGGWLYHGSKPAPQPAPPAPRTSPVDSLLEMRDFSRVFTQPERVLFLQSDGKWLMEIEGILKQLSEFIELSGGTGDRKVRSMILLDEMLLRPRDPHLQHPDVLNEQQMYQIRRQLCEIPELVSNTAVDLILFAGNAETAINIREGRMIQDDARRHLQGLRSGQQIDDGFFRAHPLSQAFPAIGWSNVTSIAWPRIDQHQPNGPFLGSETGGRKLYDALRQSPPSKPRSFVRRAEDPRRVLIDFWSTIDVRSLKVELEKNVIGQRMAITAVTEGLERFSEACQDVIRSRREPPEKEAFFPPAFLFTGESGMGKTYLAEVIADFLFGKDFFEKLELTQRTPDAELMGGDVGYVGYGEAPAFLNFCKRTGGMGLFTFDELDKVKRLQSGRLSDAVAPFLGVLQDRQLKPKSPSHANYLDERTYFRNMIIVFTANAVESGERPGYELLGNFGTPLLGRLKTKVPFTALESSDVPTAVEFFIKKYLRRIQADLLIENEVIRIDGKVINGLALDFDTKTRTRIDSRSLRTLESFVEDRLPEVSLKQKLRSGSRIITGEELNVRPWKP